MRGSGLYVLYGLIGCVCLSWILSCLIVVVAVPVPLGSESESQSVTGSNAGELRGIHDLAGSATGAGTGSGSGETQSSSRPGPRGGSEENPVPMSILMPLPISSELIARMFSNDVLELEKILSRPLTRDEKEAAWQAMETIAHFYEKAIQAAQQKTINATSAQKQTDSSPSGQHSEQPIQLPQDTNDVL